VGTARVKKMKARDDRLVVRRCYEIALSFTVFGITQDLRAESATALTAVASTSKYSSILKNLIVQVYSDDSNNIFIQWTLQGLTRLNEPTVSIHCRQSDIAKVKAVVSLQTECS
jgi:hypothetical protein